MTRLLFFLLVIFQGGCTNRDTTPDHISEVLSESSPLLNLEEVIDHYQSPGDSLKLKAAYFLLKNMSGLGSEHVTISSDSGIIAYNDYLKIGKRPDTLNAFYESQFIEDTQQISANYLIDNIKSAFAAWQNAKWKNEVGFEEFCEYVLPYRFAFELPEDWRDSVHQQYRWVLDSIKDNGSLTRVCTLINNDIRSWFTYANTQQASDLLLSYSDLYDVKAGSCLGFTSINTFTMHTFGIPVMVNFVPHWADANGGHSWNAVRIKDKLFGLLWETGLSDTQTLFPYDEDGSSLHHTFRKSGKVYRKTFEIQKSSLVEICIGKENIPPLFQNNRIKDVTNEYMPVSDVRIKLQGKFDQGAYAYLCVFNSGRWEGIQWSNISSISEVTFSDMGRDIVYLVSQYQYGRYVPISKPFHLSADGNIVFLTADSDHLVDLIASKRSHDAYISYSGYKVVPDEVYLLYLWQNDDWILLEKKTSSSSAITFHNVPSDGLYRLRAYDSSEEERIFLYTDHQQVWM